MTFSEEESYARNQRARSSVVRIVRFGRKLAYAISSDPSSEIDGYAFPAFHFCLGRISFHRALVSRPAVSWKVKTLFSEIIIRCGGFFDNQRLADVGYMQIFN